MDQLFLMTGILVTGSLLGLLLIVVSTVAEKWLLSRIDLHVDQD